MKFDPAPSEATLAGLDRQMSFEPADATLARTLSAEQVDRFNTDGYLSRLTVLDVEQTTAHRVYFDRLLERVTREGGDAYSISSAHLTYPEVYDLLCHPRIVDIVSDLLGPNVVGWGSHYFCKLPGDEKRVDWHQDASYWPMSHTKTVTVWLAIDDADTGNGCMQFISGSHRHGHLAHITDDVTANGVLGRGIQEVESLGEIVDNPLNAGQVSIHSDLLVHASPANLSGRRRCGLTLRYCSADVRAEMGWHAKGVVVRGHDESGHWANPTRPRQ